LICTAGSILRICASVRVGSTGSEKHRAPVL
jgi:hypothetical protein